MVKTKFSNLSIKKKMLFFYILSFIFPLVILSTVIYKEVSKSMIDNVRYSSKQSYEQVNNYLEYRMEQILHTSDVVVMNQEIKTLLDSKGEDVYRQMELREQLRQSIQEIEGSNQDLNIRVYVSEELSWTTDGDYIWPIAQVDTSEWYQHKGEEKVYFSPGIYLESKQSENTIALVRDIVSSENYNRRIGVLRIDIDVKAIKTTLKNAAITPNAVTYLVNTNDVVVVASDLEQMEALGFVGALEKPFTYDKYWDNNELNEGMLENQKVYYMRDKIRNTDWEMITVIPERDMLDDVLRVQGTIILVMISFGGLTIVGIVFVNSSIIKRISRLVSSMKLVQAGNLDIHLENDSEDEIGILYDNYNRMIKRVSGLMDQQYQMGQKLKSAELKALQSQINPHFLYNTLDTINWLAHAGRTNEICSTVIALSKYYRLILNKGEDVLSLGKELSHVGYYIRIQDVRYPGKIIFYQEVSLELQNFLVPKIILQPLVENAIIHGILEKKEKQGIIRITGFLDKGNVVCITVEDNGVGMDEEMLRHILDGSIRSRGSSYGIKNVNARIRIMFGEEYGLFYESKKGEGTKITLRFPARED